MKPIAVVVTLILLAAPIQADDPPKKPEEILRGEWKFLSFTKLNRENPKLVEKGKVVVADGKFTIRFEDQDDTLDFWLDPKADPPAIDFKSPKGGDKFTIRGIYKLEKDKLTICFGIENSARPTEFKPGKDNSVMVLERVKKK
jgi:uncharacterized protein (TIGR03067 family)